MAATTTISISVPKGLPEQVRELLAEGESFSAFAAQALREAALRRSSARLADSGYYTSPAYLESLDIADAERDAIDGETA